MPLFSEDLNKLQELDEQYRRERQDYDAEVAAYRTLLDRDPNDPELTKRYAEVERKNAKLQQTYTELEGLRRRLSPSQKTMPS